MAKKQENNEMEEVLSNFTYWNPENVGDSVTGIYARNFKGNFGTQYLIETEEGDVVLPSHKVLEALFSKVSVGDFVKVECVGHQPSKQAGRNPTTLYKLYKKTLK